MSRGSWGKTKPPAGVQIDWTHPLAPVFAATLQCPGISPSAFCQRALPQAAQSGIVWAGAYTEFGLSSSTAYSFSGAGIQFSAPAAGSAILRYRPNYNAGSSLAAMLAEIYDGTDRLTLGYHFSATQFFAGWITGAGGDQRIAVNASGYWTAGVPITYTFTWDANAVNKEEIWIGTALKATRTSSLTTANTADGGSSNRITIGNRDGASVSANGGIEFLLIYPRQLRSNEIAQLNAEPYCFFQPPMPYRRYFVPYVTTPPPPSQLEGYDMDMRMKLDYFYQ